MARRTRSHEQKTLAERQNYWASTVRQKQPTPTVDERTPGFDSTETPLPVGPDATPTYKTTKRPKRPLYWLRAHWIQVLAWAVGAVIFPAGGWVLFQIYSLNREVGELRTQVGVTTKQQDLLGQSLEQLKEQIRLEFDRINDRLLDRIPRR